MKSKKAKKSGGFWAFFTDSERNPKTYALFASIARAHVLLREVETMYKRQEDFDKKWEKIQELKGVLALLPPDDPKYKPTERKLDKLLGL